MESGDVDTYQEPEPECGGCSGCLESLAGLGVGDRVLLVEERHANLATMFGDESAKFQKRLWMMRTGGMIALMLGIYLLFSPIPAILSFLPFVPSILRTGFFIIAIVLGGLLSTLVSSLAWAVYHPEYLVNTKTNSPALPTLTYPINPYSHSCILFFSTPPFPYRIINTTPSNTYDKMLPMLVCMVGHTNDWQWRHPSDIRPDCNCFVFRQSDVDIVYHPCSIVCHGNHRTLSFFCPTT